MTKDQERANLELAQALARFVTIVEALGAASVAVDVAMARCRELNDVQVLSAA